MSQNSFRDDVGALLRNVGFEAHWPNKPIKNPDLKTTVTKPAEIEIDIIAKLGNVGFLVEVTKEKQKNRKKISKLLLKLEAIQNSRLSKIKLAGLFSGIPKERKNYFEDIKEWRAIYIGTSPELIYKKIKPEDFGAKQRLKIVNIDDWAYVSNLVKVIGGEYARLELLSFLGIESLLEEDHTDYRGFENYQQTKAREITEINGKSIKADIFSFPASPDFLLETCRVPRFYGLRDPDVKVFYQRMLSEKKLEDIREKFIKNNPKRTFPTPITVVLPAEIKPEKEGLSIPWRYGALTIIDGQHRLYSYALLSSDIRENAKILVNGLKFHSENPEEIGKFSARTFMDINREQMKVKTSLLYLIAYEQMGDTKDDSLAGEVIKRCNLDNKSPLHDLFEGRALGRKSKLQVPRISIVEVTKKLSGIIKDIRDPQSQKAKNVSKLLDKKFDSTPEELIKVTKSLLNGYFKKIRKVFIDDWKPKTKSLIFKTKYVAAFILLLNNFIDKTADFVEMGKRLEKIKSNLKSNLEWKSSASQVLGKERKQIFHEKREAIVPVKFSTKIIADSLRWYENNTNIFRWKK